MPCEKLQDELDQMDEPDPRLWTKRPRINGDDDREAGEDGEGEGNEENRRKWNGRTEYATIKSWVTGDCAEMEDSDIKNELHNLAREYMEQSKLKRLPNHKGNPTDIGLWKLTREQFKARSGITQQVYRCAMHYRCDCKATILVISWQNMITLQRGGTHDENSHSNDKSVY